MKSCSLVLMLALTCAQRTPAPSTATTAAAAPQRIILPDKYVVITLPTTTA
jgi:hypothetical protein